MRRALPLLAVSSGAFFVAGPSGQVYTVPKRRSVSNGNVLAALPVETMSAHGLAARRCLDQWTIAGEVILNGEPSAPVRFAGFYTSCHDFFYAARTCAPCGPARQVTTVADLGVAGGEFSLCFDVASLAPDRGHYIYLILWADANDNGCFDPGEDWKYVIPLSDDPVFAGANDCVYYFDVCADQQKGTQAGWNLSRGLEMYAPVDLASQHGARLANETAWQPHRAG